MRQVRGSHAAVHMKSTVAHLSHVVSSTVGQVQYNEAYRMNTPSCSLIVVCAKGWHTEAIGESSKSVQNSARREFIVECIEFKLDSIARKREECI